jgi:hypothetical protein
MVDNAFERLSVKFSTKISKKPVLLTGYDEEGGDGRVWGQHPKNLSPTDHHRNTSILTIQSPP